MLEDIKLAAIPLDDWGIDYGRKAAMENRAFSEKIIVPLFTPLCNQSERSTARQKVT
jgi:hypothetical protein